MTGDPITPEWAADAAASPLDHVSVSSDQDRSAGAEHRIDVLPRRPTTDASRGVGESAPVAHDDLSGERSFDDTEFKGLAASVRQWLALTRAKDIAATTPPERVDRVERLDVRATRDTVPDPRWQDREDPVESERPALLIDADHVTSDQLPHLLETVRAAYGGPIIRRAYADWTRPELASWFAQLRQHGVQPIHNFDTHDHRRSLLALTLEALDIVERSAVTRVVLVGDLGAALPLLTRLKANGVKVAVIGPASNPDDVRRAADDFLDIASLNETAATRARGRHRA